MNIMSLKKKSRAGFTLVELIVVIAILAIPAGVAIPVYSGYIKKANEAADYMLLDAARTAFGAAALSHNVNSHNIVATLEVDSSSHCITGISTVSGNLNGFTATPIGATYNPGFSAVSLSARPAEIVSAGEAAAAISESFLRFFGENKNTPLKALYNQTLAISGDDVLSMEYSKDESGNVTVTVKNNNGTATYNATKEQIDAVINSTYGTDLSGFLGDVGGMVDSLTEVLNGGGTLAAALNGLGIDLEAMGITPPYNEKKAELANAVVIAVAQNVPEGSAAGIATMMSDKTQLTGLTTTMQNASNVNDLLNNIGNITAFYALATGFASSDAASELTVTIGEGDAAVTYTAQQYYNMINEKISAAASDPEVTNPVEKAQNIMKEMAQLSNMMIGSDGNFTTQYNSYVTASGDDPSQLSKDALGFEQAMHAVSSNADALVTTGAISNGFDSSSISAILSMIFSGEN